jgi:hypothetical protein
MQPISITKTSQFMTYGEITGIYCENYMGHKSTLWQNAEFLNVTADGTYSSRFWSVQMVVRRIWLSLPLETIVTPRPNSHFANCLTCTLYNDMICHSSSFPTYFSNKVLVLFLQKSLTLHQLNILHRSYQFFFVHSLTCFCSNSNHTTQTMPTKVAQLLFI